MNKKLDLHICEFNLALFLRAIILLSPVMLLFYQENGLSVKELFFFQGIFYLTSILAEFPVGYISDIISRKKVLLISLAIYGGINLMWLVGHGYFIILLGEILFGLSKVMMDNAMSGYLYDYLSSKNKKDYMVKFYGYLNFFLALGTAVAALIGTFLYTKFGSKTVLIAEIFIILTSYILMSFVPNFKPHTEKFQQFKKQIVEFARTTISISKNKNLKYHILYSGLLTALSILFALSFQPLMQNALVPVAMFGLVAFCNHGTRALAGIFAGKWLRNFDIQKLVVPLFALYILGFGIIFKTFTCKSTVATISLLVLICIIIGIQLIFTILHVSRLHKFVTINERGNLLAVNNFISRTFAAITLITSRLFLDKMGLIQFFEVTLAVFVIFGLYIVFKITKTGEKA